MSEKKQLPLWQESLLLIGTALVMAFLVKTFFVQPFYIPSGSMEDTLKVDDRVLVQKISYWGGDPSRGDIVVFDDPGGWLDESQSQKAEGLFQETLARIGLFPTGGHLIKRVIGIGGDRVECCDQQGRLLVNGEPLDEPYVLDPEATGDQEFSIEVPRGSVWVMGDNRNNSADSRAHQGEPGGGFIKNDRVVGKAWLRLWPWERFGFIRDENSFDALSGQ